MVKEAIDLDCSTFQFFTRNPRGGSQKPFDKEDVTKANYLLNEYDFGYVVAHAPYTMNPATDDINKKEFVLKVMEEDLSLLEYFSKAYYNFHPGFYLSLSLDEGIDNIVSVLNTVLKKDQKTLSDTLKSIYDDEIKKDITKLTIQRASETLLATAISQNNNFDAFTTIIINIRLIMQIVVRCGYHPTYPQLAKLIIKVMRNALIAYTLQSLHLEDIVINGINKLVKGALNIIPGVNEIAKSLTQGAANALLTLRIGILTRKYLYKEYSLQEEIRSSLDNVILEDTISEADKDIDIVLTECKKAKI